VWSGLHTFIKQEMRFHGKLQHGVYDDCEGIHPSVIAHYYGEEDMVGWSSADRTEEDMNIDVSDDDSEDEWSSIDGDGEFEDSEDNDVMDETGNGDVVEMSLEEKLGQDQAELNIRHDPAPVPDHADPFQNDDELDIFVKALAAMEQSQVVPSGYGLLHDEWSNEGYPSFEIIQSGHHRRKEMCITLPDSIWHPRAEHWVCALFILNRMMHIQDN
jgi:hypothetical protein